MTIWLENPPKKKKTARKKAGSSRRKPPAPYRSWKVYMADLRAGSVKKNPSKRGKTVPTAKKNPTRKRAPARKKPARRRRSRARRNPPTVRATLRKVTSGIMDAGLVTGGQVLARGIPRRIEESRVAGGGAPFDEWTRIAIEAGVAIGVGYLAGMVVPAASVKMLLAGALTVPVQSAIVKLNVPGVSDQLSGVGSYRMMRGVGAYKNGGGRAISGVGAYKRLGAIPVPIRTGPTAGRRTGPLVAGVGLGAAGGAEYDGQYGY